MKKKFSVILVAVLAASVTFAALSQKTDSKNQFLKENIEALAYPEDGSYNFSSGSSYGYTSGPMCSKTGNSGDHYMPKCGDCSTYKFYAMDEVAFCSL